MLCRTDAGGFPCRHRVLNAVQIGSVFQKFSSPRIVDLLVGTNVQYIAAGALHTMAVTAVPPPPASRSRV